MVLLAAIVTKITFAEVSLPCKAKVPFLGKSPVEDIISTWGSDRILQTVIDLEQSEPCRTDPQSIAIKRILQSAFLKPLDALPDDPKNIDLFFRAFMVPFAEYQKLALKLKIKKPRKPTDLAPAFGHYRLVRGVLVIGAKHVSQLERDLKNLCPMEGECPFWNPQVLFRVVVTKTPGVAAYIPNIATLLISYDLISINNKLMRFVLVHELAHVWLRGQEIKGVDNLNGFGRFSGWKGDFLSPPKITVVGAWTDSLVSLSANSPYSIVPDGVTRNADETLDGFITERGFRKSIERHDISEDFADHLAGFFIMPSRFCWKNRPMAEKKLNWLEGHFGKQPEAHCIVK